MSSLTEAAHDLAALGWAVFPLIPRDKTPYPFTSGLKAATADVGQVVDWWTGAVPVPLRENARTGTRPVKAEPDSNIGVATGAVSGFFVLDVDGDQGLASLMKLARAFAPLPQTVRQSTGKGGHLMFAWPEGVEIRNKAGNLGRQPGKPDPYPGLDIRGNGGYIVAAPSVHPSGRVYAWAKGCDPFSRSIAGPPRWLLDLIVGEPPATSAPAPLRRLARVDGESSYGRVALDGACSAIAGARPGTQDATLHGRAYSIGRLVASGTLERSRARSALIMAGMAMAPGNPRDPWDRQTVEKKVDAAFLRASSNPKAPEPRRREAT